jgi:Fatty acid desaturase
MATATLARTAPGIWRFSRRDALLVTLTCLHAAVLAVWPVAPAIALGLWWNSNTIAHNFIHRPFFQAAALNRIFSAALSLLLGIPQTLWRDRHLAHHAGVVGRLRVSRQLVVETWLVGALWVALAWELPRFFLLAYVPGYLAGLGLCALQGYWEHAAGEPTSNYGRLYNFLCFNDGFHAEHHANPTRHWTMLADRTKPDAHTSQWPALLRWLDTPPLEPLERLVLRSPRLQRFVLRSHRKALGALLAELPRVRHAAIVGGALFPRTALILRELLPEAKITIIDANRRNLETARGWLSGDIEFRHAWYRAEKGFDLTVIPLCLQGDREAIYRNPPGAMMVHDWMWRQRGRGTIVSPLLLKRINLVRP